MCALFTKSTSEKPREAFSFHFYDPRIQTDQLVPGIDNIRFDVCLSSKFMQLCRGLIFQLILGNSDVSPLLNKPPGPPKPSDRKEFKQQLQDLLVNALNRANSQKNPQLESLAQAAIMKYLLGEMQAMYALVVVEAREKLKLFESPTHTQRARGYQLQELFGNFQKNKKIVLRLVSQELREMMEEVRGTVVRKTRESFFGSEASAPLAIFSPPLAFTEDGKDDYLYLEHYVMLGNFQRDPDRFELVEQQVRSFLEWADSHSEEQRQYRLQKEVCVELRSSLEKLRRPQEEAGAGRRFLALRGRPASAQAGQELRKKVASAEAQLEREMEAQRLVSTAYTARLERILSAPENAAMLVDVFQTERLLAEARKNNAAESAIVLLQQKAETQREALERLYKQFSRAGYLPFIFAAYEVAQIHRHFCPPINPQQLKAALVEAAERKKVAHLIQEYRLPGNARETLREAARRVHEAGKGEVRATLARFLQDFLRCEHDLRNLRLAQNLMEQVHLPTDPKQQKLSAINHTLYQFLLPEEEKPAQEKVASHVILKADIRDSTSITAQLLTQGLNPASYFSLNFFDPIRKLMPRYGAQKVFLEGDAMILAILEREGEPAGANSVARACCLARDMIEGVRGVNDRAAQSQLPLLELGIGICYQPSAPMYLMDSESPIMISKALNESDRLSGCGKLARQLLAQKNRFFNVFVMQLLPDVESRGSPEEFLLHYNIQGIEINQPAFEKLCQELSMSKVDLKLPLFGEPEAVELYCGSLPRGASGFQKIVVRRGRVPQLNPKDLRIVEYTDRCYFEVCIARPVYEYVGKQLGW